MLRDSIRLLIRARFILVNLCLLTPASLLAAAPQMQVQGRLRAAEGVMQRAVAPPGTALTGGDELRLRVTAGDAGYLYVIALGSSGSALVLEPFGGAEPSAVRAGDSMPVPRDGGYLPLDDRPGTESFVAFVTPVPLPSVASILVRLEATGDGEAGARRVLSDAGYEASFSSVRHVPVDVALAARKAPKESSSADSQASGSGPGVLSGVGSRIAEFTADREGKTAFASPEGVVSGAGSVSGPRDEAAADAAPRNGPADAGRASDDPAVSGGILAGVASLFGFGGDADARNPAPPPEPEEPAATFALGTRPDSRPATAVVAVPEPSVASESSPATVSAGGAEVPPGASPAISDEPRPSAQSVQPLAVESSLAQPADSKPPPASEPPVAGNEDLPPVESREGAPVRETGLLSSLGSLLASDPERPAEPAPVVSAPVAGTGETAPAPAAGPPAVLPESQPAETGSASAENAPQGLALALPSGETAAGSPGQERSEPESASNENSDADRGAGESDATVPAAATGGLLAGLGRVFGGGSSDVDETQPSAAPEAPATPPEAVPVVTPSEPLPEQPGLAVAEATTESETVSGNQEPAPADAGESTGLLARLGGWFSGGSVESAPEPAAAMETRPSVEPALTSRNEAAGARVNTGDEPTLTRARDEAGRSVVRLEGGTPPPTGPRRDDAVLSQAGSRIRALLDKAEPAPPARTQESAAAPVPADASPATGPVLAATDPGAVPVPAAAPEPPDPVTGALRSGEGDAALATGVALLTPPVPAAGEVVQPAMELDLLSNAGPAGSVVMVITSRGASSGVLVDTQGQVLTSWHGIQGNDSAVVVFKRDGGTGAAVESRRRARVVAHSRFSDLALLQVEGPPPGYRPAVFAADAEQVDGTSIHAVGQGPDGTWRHGVARGVRMRLNSSWYSPRRVLHRAHVIRAQVSEATTALEGPLFNQRLELVGLGAMVRSDKGELIGISAATLKAFLKASG